MLLFLFIAACVCGLFAWLELWLLLLPLKDTYEVKDIELKPEVKEAIVSKPVVCDYCECEKPEEYLEIFAPDLGGDHG